MGYQFGDPVAFALSYGRSIDQYYMDGLTLTYGSSGSRRHIWSFVNGLSEDRRGADACLCAPYASGRSAPSFVGTNYFCESGTVDESNIFSFHNEVLWDGEGALSVETLAAQLICHHTLLHNYKHPQVITVQEELAL